MISDVEGAMAQDKAMARVTMQNCSCDSWSWGEDLNPGAAEC